jgi:Predicted transcriptional regulators
MLWIKGGVMMEEKTGYMTIDEKTAEEIENKMPEESELYELADLFKVFGDSTRIKILYVLFENEMCVYDIANILNMTQSAISHQLRVLKQNRLVRYRKEGKTVLYTLADEHVFTILSQGIEHVEE